MASYDLREIARRAASRALAEADAGGPRAAGGAALVSVDCLAGVADGGEVSVPLGARVTPLAREEAFRRGIRLQGDSSAAREAPVNRSPAVTIAVASDHGGFELKGVLVERLRELGRVPLDLGPRSPESCDYPDFAAAVARRVAAGTAALGVVVDGAGIGSAMAANKLPGALAANCWNVASARNAREHNHANILTLGAGHLSAAAACEVLEAFLGTPVGPGRHARRVGLIRALEQSPAPRIDR